MARLVGRHHMISRFGWPPLLHQVGERLVDKGLDLPALGQRYASHLGKYFGVDLCGELFTSRRAHGRLRRHCFSGSQSRDAPIRTRLWEMETRMTFTPAAPRPQPHRAGQYGERSPDVGDLPRAKLKAGKALIRVRLPPRSPGKADMIRIGGRAGSGRYDPEAELREPLPEPPVFEEDLESVRQRVARTVGKVVRSRDLAAPVPAIRRLLAADAQRAEKFRQDPWPWHAPYFQSRFEQRRLRLLDALAKALSRQGVWPDDSPQHVRRL